MELNIVSKGIAMRNKQVKWAFNFVWQAETEITKEITMGEKTVHVRTKNLQYKDILERAYVKVINGLIKRFGSNADIKVCLKPLTPQG